MIENLKMQLCEQSIDKVHCELTSIFNAYDIDMLIIFKNHIDMLIIFKIIYIHKCDEEY